MSIESYYCTYFALLFGSYELIACQFVFFTLGILIVSALGVALGLVIGVTLLSVVLFFVKRYVRKACTEAHAQTLL